MDGTNTIVMVPENELSIDDQMLDSANSLGYEAIGENERRRAR
jgi:hypothetical protein